MKKWLLAFSLIVLTVASFWFWIKPAIYSPPPNDNVLSATEVLSPTPHAWKQSTVINFDGTAIRISWAIAEPKDVELYSNLKEQKLSEEIKINKSCQALINGGFYSKENTHLGSFVADFKTISDPLQNALLNGFIWITADNKVLIGINWPSITPRLGLQAGPLLMLDSKSLVLSINNDEPKRRIVAAVTPDNRLIFLVFYRDSAEFEGPMLGSLPEILNLFKKQTNVNFVDAINLDGGSASVFVSNYDLLRELTIVGSYVCVKSAL